LKLLLDENLSFRVVGDLAEHFPDSSHVDLLGLRGQDDASIWRHAAEHGYVLVSKDDDFRQLSLLHGAPPKVVLCAIGNAGNAEVVAVMVENRDRVQHFIDDELESLLILKR
jgi:predicted nuclease of predicted toxin-antitoxin system